MERNRVMEIPNKKQKQERLDSYKIYVQSLLTANVLQSGTTYHNIDPSYAMMPDVIYWDLQHQCIMNGLDVGLLKCPQCDGNLYTMSATKFHLRQLYCLNDMKLLATSTLQCMHTKKHEILGYDPRLLKLVSSQVHVPFKLFHRSGTTQELAQYIFDEIYSGVQVKQLHDVLVENYSKTFENKKDLYSTTQLNDNRQLPDGEIGLMVGRLTPPSPPLITQCFLTQFEEKETLFKNTMASVKTDGLVVIDDEHELSLPTTCRNKLKRNSALANRMLFILNEKKQIMFWKFTSSGKSLEDVTVFLKSLDQANLTGCLSNHCCEWSALLKDTLGDRFIVKANIYLFIEKVSRLFIDLDDPNQADCLHDLKEIFCRPDDSLESRVLPTADAVTVERKLHEFLDSWSNVATKSGEMILHERLLQEITSIKTHIANGCFSDIPPLYQDNSQHASMFYDIYSNLEKWTSNIHLGIGMVTAIVSIGFHDVNKENGVLDKRMIEEDHNVTTALTPLSPLDKLIQSVSDKIERIGDVNKHVIRFLMYLKCFQSVSYCAPDLLVSPQLVPHFVSSIQLASVPYFSHAGEMNSDYFNDVERLRSLINWTDSKATEDSVTFLSSFVNYIYKLDKSKPQVENYMSFIKSELSIDFEKPIDEVMEKSKDLLQSSGAHAQVPFMGLSFAECVSNLFRVVFLFVTTLKRFPIVPVYPSEYFPASPFILVLIEDNQVVVMLEPSSLVSQPEEPTVTKNKNFNCRCGRGQAESSLPPKCINIQGSSYSSRCYCFRAGEPCSDICDCRACANPYGTHLTRQRIRVFDQTKPVRKRNKHDAQESFRRIFSRYFSSRKHGGTKDWKYCEYLLFDYVLNDIVEEFHLKQDGLLTWSNLPVLVDLISERYHTIANVLKAFDHIFEDHIRNQNKLTLENRYKERQEYVNTKFEE